MRLRLQFVGDGIKHIKMLTGRTQHGELEGNRRTGAAINLKQSRDSNEKPSRRGRQPV